MTKPQSRTALLDEILAQARSSFSACVQDRSLKDLAWAYVHGARHGTDEEKIFERLLIAKAKES